MNIDQAKIVLVRLATEVLDYEFFTNKSEAAKHAEALSIVSGKTYEVVLERGPDEKYWVRPK